jgi:hypothetical protein
LWPYTTNDKELFPDRAQEPPPPIQLETGPEYTVEAIIGHRKRQNKMEYKVKWEGYPDYENTWEPVANLTNAKELITDYLDHQTSHIDLLTTRALGIMSSDKDCTKTLQVKKGEGNKEELHQSHT